jgi:serine beta-lactamase-like protein LACTB
MCSLERNESLDATTFYGSCLLQQRFYAYHTGGAVGASSVLLVLPSSKMDNKAETTGDSMLPPQGVVVAVLCNMQGVGLTEMALAIAKEFEAVKEKGPYRVQKVYQC